MSRSQTSGNLSRIQRMSRSVVGRATGRFTRSIGHSATLQAAGRFFRRQLWIWPIVAALILGVSGWWVDRTVENALRDQRIAELNAIVDANVESLRVWMAEERCIADLMSQDEVLIEQVNKLLAIAESKPEPMRDLVQSESQQVIRRRLAEKLPRGHYSGFVLASRSGLILAADQEPPIGRTLTGYRKEFFDRVLARESLVSKPFRSPLLLADEKGDLAANLPTMFAAAAMDVKGQVIAALGLRIRPDQEFTQILRTARMGQTGETYAFDRNGQFLSNSRFDEDLKQIGLLVDAPGSQSTLTLEMRNPGVDMTQGKRPALRRAEQPLTKPAAEASQGRNGIDPDGYPDYRGAPNVGAWRWLPEYDFGVVAEMDLVEAVRPAILLRRAFWILMSLLILGSLAIFVAMLYIAKQQKALQHATLAAKQLGQYSLENKLGAGGMGTVYKARHAMLRRPTAIKLLDVDRISEAAILRFEREVQLTAGLTHPNTIQVFDYGRTPEGIFYYAMEYLEGINLDDLVQRHGPMSEARAMYLLRQICGSLAEAHANGLVHRDIKPANIILTIRGGVHDFVKVLDFGLAKVTESAEASNLTGASAITGTPLYLSPEAVNSPDQVNAASDVYAIGAVAYFLMTATPVFNGSTVMEICMKHVTAAPEPPSTRTGHTISAEFEKLVMRCLAKPQAERPKDAGELLIELDRVVLSDSWNEAAARSWWTTSKREKLESKPDDAATLVLPKTLPGAEMTMAYEPGAK